MKGEGEEPTKQTSIWTQNFIVFESCFFTVLVTCFQDISRWYIVYWSQCQFRCIAYENICHFFLLPKFKMAFYSSSKKSILTCNLIRLQRYIARIGEVHNRKNIILDYMFIVYPIVCWDVFGPCFVMQYLVPFLACQSPRWERHGWLFCSDRFLGVMYVHAVSSERWLCSLAGLFELALVGTPKDRFSPDTAHLWYGSYVEKVHVHVPMYTTAIGFMASSLLIPNSLISSVVCR